MARATVHDDSTLPPRQRAVASVAEKRPSTGNFVSSGLRLVGDENPITTSDNSSALELTERSTLPASLRQFGDYELIEEVARGGMGIVYKAWQLSLKRIVAIKMILSGLVASEEDINRFYAEAQAAASLSHAGIVQIFEVDQVHGQHFNAMEFIDGISLSRRAALGPLEPVEAATLMRRVADAVQYAHERGVVHRDLKPANIIVDYNGQPHVTDFGLAYIQEGHDQQTCSGEPIGTASYMPPEQATGQRDKIGPPSDVYSLGATLYCLITGRPPFQSSNSADTLIQVIQVDPVPPRRLNQQIPNDLETICLKCLEKLPDRRYATAQELSDELRRYLRNEPILARPIGPWTRLMKWRQRHRSLAAVASVLIAAVATLIASSIMYNRQLIAEREAAQISERQAVRLLELTQSLFSQLGHLSKSETALLTLQVSEYAEMCAIFEQLSVMEHSPKADATRVRLQDQIERLAVSATPTTQEALKRLANLLSEPHSTTSKPFAEELRVFLDVCRRSWLENTRRSPNIREQVQKLLREQTLQASDLLLNRAKATDHHELEKRWSTLRHGLFIVANDTLPPLIDDVIAQIKQWSDHRPPRLNESLGHLQAALRTQI